MFRVIYMIAKGDKIDQANSEQISIRLVRIIFNLTGNPITRLDKGDVLHGNGFSCWAEER